MDFSTPATHTLEDNIADRKRLDSFRLGGSVPSTSHHARKLSHSRSHSRNASISPPTLSLSSIAAPSLPSPNSPPSSPPPLPQAGNSKRNSHHRRRSSVSTRRESAEIMGVQLLSTSASCPDENINLGDKDSIRRRALLTLEGKTDVGAFSKVEIPELSTPDIEKRFDFPTKPSFPPGIGAGAGGSLSSLAGSKRDSFGKFRASVSAKEQLGTLMEEDEEAEDSCDTLAGATVLSPVQETAEEPIIPSARARPASLRLRPLSLASNYAQLHVGDLPTPEPSPGVQTRPGLRALTLSPSLSIESTPSSSDSDYNVSTRKRQSVMVPSSAAPSFQFGRRSSISNAPDGRPIPVARRSSISYVSSTDSVVSPHPGLPTPEMTPTSERRYSITSDASSSSMSSQGTRSSRSLSTSEHHFLYQAHAALVQRISDLERVLSTRPRSRPLSYASEVSIPSEPPTDEMLQLVADLKAERDELKKDVEGWRTRLSDSEHQVTLLVKRVEVERREAWVARERAGLIEIEKKSLEKTLADKAIWGEEGWKKYEESQGELVKAMDECQRLKDQLARFAEIQAECCKLAAALAEERKRREDVERELEVVLATPTPQAIDNKYRTPPVSRTMVYAKRGGLGFQSIDSTGSFTDVESLSDPCERLNFSLKSVEEEDEDANSELSQSYSSDAENGLAGYEDEDENDDYSFQASCSNSSFGSDDGPRETSHLLDMSFESETPELTLSRSTSSSPPLPSPPQHHDRHASLSKTWTFPQHVKTAEENHEEIDRFFGCLQDVDNSPPVDSRLRSLESSKALFSQALAEADDDFSPFMIPTAVGVEISTSTSKTVLDVVVEEDEEEAEDVLTDDDNDTNEIVGQVVDGGIIFTFCPPPDFEGPDDLPTPEARPEPEPARPVLSPESTHSVSSSRSLSSSIPRPAPRVFTSAIPTISTTPPKPSSVSSPKATGSPASFMTPVKSQSSPQPLASSTPRRAQPASFIPQPRRSPASSVPSKSLYSTPTKSQSKPRSSIRDASDVQPSQSSSLLSSPPSSSSISPTVQDVPVSPAMSPTLAALQTLTSFLPMPSLPWSSPRLKSALCVVSSSSTSSSMAETFSAEATQSPTSPQPSMSAGKAYVSRESQLAKLRLRLQHERSQRQDTPPLFHASDYQHGMLDI